MVKLTRSIGVIVAVVAVWLLSVESVIDVTRLSGMATGSSPGELRAAAAEVSVTPPTQPPLQGFAIGTEAPEIIGEDLAGVPFKLSDYRGKVVVLDFWGDW
jgi:hypothetical protein